MCAVATAPACAVVAYGMGAGATQRGSEGGGHSCYPGFLLRGCYEGSARRRRCPAGPTPEGRAPERLRSAAGSEMRGLPVASSTEEIEDGRDE